MSRNPADHPFPSFLPNEAGMLRKKRAANDAIREMVDGLKPVVPFSKPDLVFTRPPWSTSMAVRHDYSPGIDLLHKKEDSNQPTPTLVQPKWVNIIPRVVSGCPQLGLVMVNEPDANQSTTKHMSKRLRKILNRRIPQTNDQHVATLTRSSALTPRYQAQSKQDITLELLKDPKVYHSIKQAVTQQKKKERSTSVLVSLPKIGVRLFSFARSTSSREGPGKSLTARSREPTVKLPQLD